MKTRPKSLFNIFTLFVLLLVGTVNVAQFSVFVPPPPGPPPIIVNTTDDELNADGDCSLREAIQALNTNSTVDTCVANAPTTTIILPADTYTLTLTGSGEDNNATGDIDIKDNITINGAGAGTTIIQASTCNPVTLIDSVTQATNCTPATDRVFDITGVYTVAISGVTIRHGKTNSSGGGINNFYGALTLTNSAVSNSTAQTGGGIYNHTGRTLAMTGSTISGNSSSGIYNVGTLTVTDSTLSGNSADVLGGAILNNNGGTATVTGSTISGNTGGGIYNNNTLTVNGGSTISNNAGGGIYNYGTTLTVTNSTISGNYGAHDGGGIHNEGSTTTITGSTISGNSANIAGGIFNRGTLLTLANSTVSGNSATGSAGGIQNYSGSSTLTVTNSTILNNSAVNYGGIDSRGPMTITNSTISGNSSVNFAGGIYVSSSTASITNSTISGNSAAAGGGIGNNSTLNLTNSTISGNTAGNSGGGGIYNFGTLNYANTIIANSGLQSDCLNSGGTIGTNTNNLVEDGLCSASLSGDPNLGPLANNGGATQTLALLTGSAAINAGNDSACNAAPVSNLDQRGNTRAVSYLHCDIGAYEYLDKTTFVVNTNDDLTDDASCNASDCSLREAIYAANGNPAADTIIFADTLLPITLGSGLPTINDASGLIINGGGDITIDGANLYQAFNVASGKALTLESITVTQGSNDYGAIFNSGTLNLLNSTIMNSTATVGGGYGGAVFNASNASILILNGSTLDGNIALNRGGAIYNNGTVTITNGSVLTNNHSVNEGGGVYNDGGTLNVTGNSTLDGNYTTGASKSGGGIYNNTGNVTVSESTFSANIAKYNGGAIYSLNGNLTVMNSLFENNDADFQGGGIYDNGATVTTVTSSTFSGNLTHASSGGGIMKLGVSGTLNITNSIFLNNTVRFYAGAGNGGGIYNNDGALSVTNSVFNANLTNYNGGGIYNGGAMTIKDSTLNNNDSGVSGYGGGIYNNAGSATITGSTINNNSVGSSGGGIYNAATMTIANSTIFKNTANLAGGGGITNSGVLVITNSTLSHNYAGTLGGGLYNSSSATIYNSIIANSTNGGDCINSSVLTANAYNLDSDNSCGGARTSSSINLGPLKDNGGLTWSMALGINSAAIDEGDNTICSATIGSPNYGVDGLDQRGVKRLPDTACDIGAFERETSLIKSATASDGWTLESKELSNIASTLNASGKLRVGDDVRNRQYRSLLFFDTSSIPNNAVITKVMVKIYKSGAIGTDPFTTTTHSDLVADIKKGFFGLGKLELGDFNAAAEPINNAGRFKDIGSGWYQLTLSSVNFKYVNVFGATQFRIRFVLDDNNNKTADIALFDSGGDANPPQLIVEYSVP